MLQKIKKSGGREGISMPPPEGVITGGGVGGN